MIDDENVLDLDEARAAKRERAERRAIRLGGREFEVVDELPIDTMELASQGRFREALVGLLVDPEADGDELLSHHPKLSEFESILGHVFGVDLGEASASSPRSGSTSRRSRPTS
ncbi:MAG: hypothetical protein AAGA99_21080 [Actinomycetota bacterium]